MEYKNFWDESVSLYNFVEEQKCLCLYEKSLETFVEFSKACFEESEVSGEKEECQLLAINVFRLLAETYVAEINKYQRICKKMQTFFRLLCKEDMFYYMVDRYLMAHNQHLSWSFVKTLSAISYGTELCYTKEWINFIVKNSMLQLSDDKCFRLIELLSFLVGYGLKSSHYRNDDSKCQNIINCTLPSPKDHYICVCSELVIYWNKLVEIYCNPDSTDDKKEISFLQLWKLVINDPLQEDLSIIYLNKKFILDILHQGTLNRPKVVSLYMEVVIKIICSNLKCRPWVEADCMLIEKSLTTALSNGFLESIPTDDQEFCNAIKKTISYGSLSPSAEVEEKFGAVGKKIIFILMNLLAEFQNMQLLGESYQKIITLINQRNLLSPLWLVNMFLDDDDLLFGVMLASLRIYKSLQSESYIRTEQSPIELFLLHDINPHALFLKLLQLLGCDHNELISFLVSDETCCLLYLTEYLKLLLNEKQEFIKTYIMLVSDKKLSFKNIADEKKNQSSAKQSKSHVDKVQYHSSSAEDCSAGSSMIKISTTISTEFNGEKDEISKNDCLLVTYSSSSSEDESCNENENDVENLLKIVSVLTNLKKGIKKLVNINEFPYNITHFLFLLQSCEDLFR